MHTKRLVITFSILLLSLSLFCQQKEIDIILIGGQSNATGQGLVRNIPQSFKIDKRVKFFYSPYLNQGKGADQWTTLTQASETPHKFGVELSLGTHLKEAFPERELGLIKHALSGSHLYGQWNPGNKTGQKQGLEYKKFITTVQKALDEIKKQGYTPRIRAMVWQQGEGDARDIAGMENSNNYAKNLANLIQQIRTTLNVPEMIFVYGEVIPLEAVRFPGREVVRQAQKNICQTSKSQHSIKNAFLVEGDDLQLLRSDYKTPRPQDDVHLGTFGILTLGQRFAQKIIKHAHWIK